VGLISVFFFFFAFFLLFVNFQAFFNITFSLTPKFTTRPRPSPPLATSRGVRFGKLGTRTTGGAAAAAGDDESAGPGSPLSASEVREARLLAIASVDHGALARLASTVCARAETRDVLALADCLPFAPAGTPEHDVRGRTIPVTSDAVLIPLVARTVRTGGSGTEIDALGGRVHDRAALGRAVATYARRAFAALLAGFTELRAVSIYFFFFKTGFHI
jgi:hypothetical protein